MLTPNRQEVASGGQPLGQGTVLRGRFVLKERLDHGRFGVVYKALDRQSVAWDGSPGHVAVLILPPEIGANRRALAAVREDFMRLRSLTHPNIVGVADFDSDGDLHFLTMELVDGESLRTVLDNLHPEVLWQKEALEVVHAVGAALDFAHQRGIVHGDVRAENVIVAGPRDVRLLFASTCLLRSAPFATDPRDDVFGLGCLAYELLTGTPPFAGQGSAAVEPAREPRRIKGLPRRQWDALRASLAPRDRRTRSVARFLWEMRLIEAPRREVRRAARRGASTSFAVVALLALLGTGAYLYREPLMRTLAPGTLRDMLIMATPMSDGPGASTSAAAPGTPAVSEPGAGPPTGQTPAEAASSQPPPSEQVLAEAPPTEPSAVTPAEAAASERPPTEAKASGLPPSVTADPAAGEGERPDPGTLDAPPTVAAAPPGGRIEPSVQRAEAPPASAEAPAASDEAPSAAAPRPEARPAQRAARAPDVFGFAARGVTVTEGASVAVADIVRLSGSGPVSVAWWTSDGTALADEDYANFGAVIETFEAGERRRTIRIPITADGIPEDREAFHVNLRGRPDGGPTADGAVTRMTITIVDDD